MSAKRQNAEGIVQKYLKAWRRKSYTGMLTLAQPTWKEVLKTPKTTIKVMHELYNLKSFDVRTITQISGISTDVEVELTYALSGKLVSKTHIIRVVCETGPFQPSEKGKWFVNPLSTFTNRGAT